MIARVRISGVFDGGRIAGGVGERLRGMAAQALSPFQDEVEMSRGANRIIMVAVVVLTGACGQCPATEFLGVPDPDIDVSPRLLTLEVGEEGVIIATVSNLADGSVTFSSSNQAVAVAIATSYQSATIRCIAPGSATITVASIDPDVTTGVTVVCVPIPLAVTITPPELTLQVGTTGTLACAVRRTAPVPDVPLPGEPVTWTSSDPSVVQVSATGAVFGASTGEATITCSVNRQPTSLATATVRVTAPPPSCGGSGTITFAIAIDSDPFGHAPFIGMPGSRALIIAVMENGQITVNGAPPFVPVMGTINEQCEIAATGTGTVAGMPGVGVRLTGPFPAQGPFDWLYEMGVPGGLPGGPTTYRFGRQ
jgi:hypothetical protein